jgi:hypothetical protein
MNLTTVKTGLRKFRSGKNAEIIFKLKNSNFGFSVESAINGETQTVFFDSLQSAEKLFEETQKNILDNAS